jgi:hypothetical protein
MSNLEIRRINRLEAMAAQGVVIVIDVIRAFTVAAYAFLVIPIFLLTKSKRS